MKVKVLTTDDKFKTLVLSRGDYQLLKLEFTGQKGFLSEYKTTKGEIITDLEIQRIEKIVK